MSGFQPHAYPESRPARLQQRNGGEIVGESQPEYVPRSFGEKVGMVFMWGASIAIALGGLGWLINNFFPHLWSIL